VAIELHPLDQFKIEPIIPIHIGGIDASFTNSALFMVITIALASVVGVWGSRGRALVPSRWQSLAEISYEFIAGMIDDNVGHEGRDYFPFIFTLFMFIFFGNLLGLIPYGYTFTSQIIVTFAMAAVVFIGVTIIGIAKHGWHFLSFFVPPGVPFANMMAGHTMLAIFAGFVAPLLLAAGAIKAFAVVPLGVDILLIFLELLVAALQAYVFTILTCLYLRDAIHLH
jgi:F-type H+-transporting ATPase subunit a